MSQINIRIALESRLKAWADSRLEPLQVAYENVTFDKPADEMFLECFLIPNVTLSRDTSATRRTHLGMFQVNVWSMKNSGMRDAETVVGELTTLFPHSLTLDGLTLTSPPSADRPVQDDSGWIITPVLIHYRYDT